MNSFASFLVPALSKLHYGLEYIKSLIQGLPASTPLPLPQSYLFMFYFCFHTCHPPVLTRLRSLRAKTPHCLVHSCGSNPIMEHAVLLRFLLTSTESLLYVKVFLSRGNNTWGNPCWTSFADCQVTVWYPRTSPTHPLKREMPRTGSRLSTPASMQRKTNLGDITQEQQALCPFRRRLLFPTCPTQATPAMLQIKSTWSCEKWKKSEWLFERLVESPSLSIQQVNFSCPWRNSNNF